MKMMNYSWYEVVSAKEPITQGDLIERCPLLKWSDNIPLIESGELSDLIITVQSDVIVMTQACDLENNKVENVILCPCYPLSRFRTDWEQSQTTEEQKQKTKDKLWKSFCDGVCAGRYWNYSILNESNANSKKTEHRIVDFSDVYTLPRKFLEGFLVQSNVHRLRLLPPYREHLSQSFARFFMRVGLPVSVNKNWADS
jgi:hypothetical protein